MPRAHNCFVSVCFFNDILIYSSTWELHLQQLSTVLQLLQTHALFAKLSKCAFSQTQIDYLGHIITGTGFEMDPSKVSVMKVWPQPKSITEIRGFLGLTGYYRRFIMHYATIAGPLTGLLRKDFCTWNKAAELAFVTLKLAMTHAPVLALLDFSQPFTVDTDASNIAIGVVLSQAVVAAAKPSSPLQPSIPTHNLQPSSPTISNWLITG